MSRWLLDTNVVSELRKPGCDPRVRVWSEAQHPKSFFLSTITIAEIRFGIERHPDAAFRVELSVWLDQTLRPWFGASILEVGEDVILEWRRMVERGRRIRHTYSQPDLFLAATASFHGLTMATRNVADFEHTGVPVFDPWTHETITPGER
ncbi:MAG: type II toxin-antitoxin system VapC family toxin [Geminicoccales bacterium]